MTDTPTNPVDAELYRLATESDEQEAKAEDTLELGTEEAPVATEEDKVEEEAKKEKRGRPWSHRVDVLTARLREAEKEAAELRARAAPPEASNDSAAPDPNDPKYEFGEADPNYLRDWAAHTVRETLAEERKKSAEAEQANASQRELTGKLQDGLSNVEKTGAEKYEDFEAKITEAVEARGGEPLHPMVSIGIAVSPAGADIAYRMATDETIADKIEKLAQTSPQQAAVAFGELEGEYVDDDADLNLTDPLDMARMLGRMKSRLAGKKAPAPAERKTTKAPPPPENRARGATGQFEVGDDTEDFAAFERKIMGAGK